MKIKIKVLWFIFTTGLKFVIKLPQFWISIISLLLFISMIFTSDVLIWTLWSIAYLLMICLVVSLKGVMLVNETIEQLKKEKESLTNETISE